MKMNARYLLLALLSLGCAGTRHGTTEAAAPLPAVWTKAGVSRAEAEHLVNESLRLILERKCLLGDLHFLADPKRIPVLVTEEVRSLELKNVGDVSFEPVTASTLAERAEAHGSYVYSFRFGWVSRPDSTIALEVVNVPTYAANPKTRAFGSGVTIEFSRQENRWEHSCARGWIE